MTSSLRTPKLLQLLFLISSAHVASMACVEPAGKIYWYRSGGRYRESAKWDDLGRRFIVSFLEGGVGQIPVSAAADRRTPEILFEEAAVVNDRDLAQNSSLGLAIDRPRNRLLVVISDLSDNRYSALAAYDLDTWKRIFLTRLNGPDERALADDVGFDPTGTAYVTDTRNSKLWKVGADGSLIGVIESPLFSDECYEGLTGLNGIIYHADGFFLVVHTSSGSLFKIVVLDNGGEEVRLVKIVNGGGSLLLGDGLELWSPTKLVVAGRYPSGRLVESFDGWETAAVVGEFSRLAQREATAATVKDGKAFLSYVLGDKEHAIVEAVFSDSSESTR